MFEAATVREVLRRLGEADSYPRIGNEDWPVAARMKPTRLGKARLPRRRRMTPGGDGMGAAQTCRTRCRPRCSRAWRSIGGGRAGVSARRSCAWLAPPT